MAAACSAVKDDTLKPISLRSRSKIVRNGAVTGGQDNQAFGDGGCRHDGAMGAGQGGRDQGGVRPLALNQGHHGACVHDHCGAQTPVAGS